MDETAAKEMLAYQHSGFSVDAGVRIKADDRASADSPACPGRLPSLPLNSLAHIQASSTPSGAR